MTATPKRPTDAELAAVILALVQDGRRGRARTECDGFCDEPDCVTRKGREAIRALDAADALAASAEPSSADAPRVFRKLSSTIIVYDGSAIESVTEGVEELGNVRTTTTRNELSNADGYMAVLVRHGYREETFLRAAGVEGA